MSEQICGDEDSASNEGAEMNGSGKCPDCGLYWPAALLEKSCPECGRVSYGSSRLEYRRLGDE